MRFFLVLLLVLPLAARKSGFKALFADYDRPSTPGASVIVIHHGKVICRDAFGMANLEAHEKSTPRTNYRLASLTKQFTAMSILLLAHDRRLGFDDPIRGYLPEMPPYAEPIHIRHLLRHTSGLRDYESLIPEARKEQVHDRDVLGAGCRPGRRRFSARQPRPVQQHRLCSAQPDRGARVGPPLRRFPRATDLQTRGDARQRRA